MKENQNPKAIYLKDYEAPQFLIRSTELSFDLRKEQTTVNSRIEFYRNPDAQAKENDLALNGVDLNLIKLNLNGEALDEDQYKVDEEYLYLLDVPDEFVLEVENTIQPDLNKALEGLYVSKGMYCTQCEAHGFRRITYYLDRPDVMSVFTVRIEADKNDFPILLSNGNCTDKGEEGDRHWRVWLDPHKKPCYLFALVAGDLVCVEDEFIRKSGNPVRLALYVEEHDADKCDYAIDSLKRAMKWDEDVFGREYDLDIYMIVAVSHFNMGAMENKGLNIFNTSCVLANAKTTTDLGFERVEGVVAHEYFHNWSGNRVTCRDWFQLSLKEGFTVFRDEEFSSDMGSRTVKRIDDVNILRTHQFKEDSGPMAHPVRPASYIEMNNFYTVTVYNKGSEVVRMIHTLLGAEQFRKGCDLYFKRHDGQAVTCDDFVAAMEDASGINLSQFILWYSQAGTPTLDMSTSHNDGKFILTFKQKASDTPEQKAVDKKPFVIPVRIAFFNSEGEKQTFTDENGRFVQETVLAVDAQEKSFSFNLDKNCIPSVLRGFSAPVRLGFNYSQEDRATLLAYDDDGFNAWEAGQTLALNELDTLMGQLESGQALGLSESFLKAYKVLLNNDSIEKALLSRLITLPTKAYIAEQNEDIDVDKIVTAHNFMEQSLAEIYYPEFKAIYQANKTEGAYAPTAEQVAQRSLKCVCLHYCALANPAEASFLAAQQFDQANNMTDQSSGLKNILLAESKDSNSYLQRFFQEWKEEALVIDQWFSMQVLQRGSAGLDNAEQLLKHEAFDIENPNRVRSVLGALAQNFEAFHDASGRGYEILTAQIAILNDINPQVAARMVSVLIHWKRFDKIRAEKMKSCLESLMAKDKLSKDVYEIVSKALK